MSCCAARSPGQNLLREYLQARILAELQRAGAMLSLAFQGGTALRFLSRYSEDLDFTLERSTPPFDFRDALRAIRAAFEQEGYAVTIKLREQSAVKSAFVGFPGLPFELALSPHRDEALRVKVEIDTNPPAGPGLTTTICGISATPVGHRPISRCSTMRLCKPAGAARR